MGPLHWVAAKELKLSYQNSKTILLTIYIYIHILDMDPKWATAEDQPWRDHEQSKWIPN